MTIRYWLIYTGAPKLQPKTIFLSAAVIGGNTSNILNCHFSKYIFFSHINLNIYICKTKLTSYEQYLLGLPFAWNSKKIRGDQNLLQVISLYLKKTIHKPSGGAAAEN